MRVHWRQIPGTKNSYAALYAACELSGFSLESVDEPTDEVTCYSLNSISEPHFREEIRGASCITIVGGPHASACPQAVAEYADYVVVGEGEYTLPALLRSIERGSSTLPAGVATKDNFTPARHCVCLNAYPPFSTMKGYIEISRGCPHACAYCQTPRIFGHRMRHRSIDTICRAARRYRDVRFISPNAFAYGSDGITPRLEKVERLLRQLDNRIFFATFPSEVRPEFITPASLDLLDRYCANRKVHFGAQSGSERVLKRIGRGHSSGDVIAAVELCHDHGFTPVVDYIVGFPFETDEDQRETLSQIEWVTNHGMVHAHYFTPLPGTPLGGAHPRVLLPEVNRTLGRLALKGKLTGSWIDPEVRFFRQN
jgi:B12-binding domain/radical SAM domain protein